MTCAKIYQFHPDNVEISDSKCSGIHVLLQEVASKKTPCSTGKYEPVTFHRVKKANFLHSYPFIMGNISQVVQTKSTLAPIMYSYK